MERPTERPKVKKVNPLAGKGRTLRNGMSIKSSLTGKIYRN
jgi:hypothetical protein